MEAATEARTLRDLLDVQLDRDAMASNPVGALEKLGRVGVEQPSWSDGEYRVSCLIGDMSTVYVKLFAKAETINEAAFRCCEMWLDRR